MNMKELMAAIKRTFTRPIPTKATNTPTKVAPISVSTPVITPPPVSYPPLASVTKSTLTNAELRFYLGIDALELQQFLMSKRSLRPSEETVGDKRHTCWNTAAVKKYLKSPQ